MSEHVVPSKQPIDLIAAIASVVLAVCIFVVVHFVPDLAETLQPIAATIIAFAVPALMRYVGVLPGTKAGDLAVQGKRK